MRRLTVLASAAALLVATIAPASPAESQEPGNAEAPWGLATATNPDVTAAVFRSALPQTLGTLRLAEESTAEPPTYDFALRSDLFSYEDSREANDPGGFYFFSVFAHTLFGDVSTIEALTKIRDDRLQSSDLQVESQNLSDETAVPFVTGTVWTRGLGGNRLNTLVWGARRGSTVFAIAALDPADLEAFVRSLVANLGGSPGNRGNVAETPPSDGPSSGCELVELYPGYPGFAGYVTGVDGVGDHRCVEELIATDASFSRDREDAANREAARRIGLNGTIAEWTWENWMAIEAERGLPPTCWTCVIFAAPGRTEPSGTGVSPNDPRLLAGTPGGTNLLARLATEHDIPLWTLTDTFTEDLGLRGLAGLFATREHLTAQELLPLYDELIEFLYTPSGRFLETGQLYDNLIAQGGYAPTTSHAVPEDQLFTIRVGALSLCPFLPSSSCSQILDRFTRWETEWEIERLSDPGLGYAEFLQNQGAQDYL